MSVEPTEERLEPSTRTEHPIQSALEERATGRTRSLVVEFSSFVPVQRATAIWAAWIHQAATPVLADFLIDIVDIDIQTKPFTANATLRWASALIQPSAPKIAAYHSAQPSRLRTESR